MPQIFHRSNTLSKVSIAAALLTLAFLLWSLYVVGWSPYVTQQRIARVQPVDTVVGLTIATLKGTLVILVFMHLLESPRVSWLALGIGIFWLGILMGLTLTDYLTRHWLVF